MHNGQYVASRAFRDAACLGRGVQGVEVVPGALHLANRQPVLLMTSRSLLYFLSHLQRHVDRIAHRGTGTAGLNRRFWVLLLSDIVVTYQYQMGATDGRHD